MDTDSLKRECNELIDRVLALRKKDRELEGAIQVLQEQLAALEQKPFGEQPKPEPQAQEPGQSPDRQEPGLQSQEPGQSPDRQEPGLQSQEPGQSPDRQEPGLQSQEPGQSPDRQEPEPQAQEPGQSPDQKKPDTESRDPELSPGSQEPEPQASILKDPLPALPVAALPEGRVPPALTGQEEARLKQQVGLLNAGKEIVIVYEGRESFAARLLNPLLFLLILLLTAAGAAVLAYLGRL